LALVAELGLASIETAAVDTVCDSIEISDEEKDDIDAAFQASMAIASEEHLTDLVHTICPVPTRGRTARSADTILSQDEISEIAKDISENGILRPLIALLRRLIVAQGSRAVAAAKLYLNLTRITAPLGVAMFDGFAFGDVLQLCNRIRRMCFVAGDGRKRKARKQKKRDADSDDDSDEEENDCPDDNQIGVDSLLQLVTDAANMFQNAVSIGSFFEVARQTAETAAQIAVALAASSQNSDLLRATTALLRTVGAARESSALTMHAAMPALLLGDASKAGSPGKWTLEVRSSVLAAVVETAQSANGSAVLIWLQHLCTNAPEKSELRTLAVEAAVAVARALSWKTQVEFCDFVKALGASGKPGHRQIALDAAAALLNAGLALDQASQEGVSSPALRVELVEEAEAIENQDEIAQMPSPSPREPTRTGLDLGETLLHLMLHRTKDKAPGVRCKALAVITAMLKLAGSKLPWSLVRTSFHIGGVAQNSTSLQTPRSTPQEAPDTADLGLALSDALVRRIGDSKPMVRKAALQCLNSLALCSGPLRCIFSTRQYLDAFVQRTCDGSAACRKDALKAIHSMLCAPGGANPMVAAAWSEAVLPSVLDAEQSVQDYAVQLVYGALIEPGHQGHDLMQENEDTATFWALMGTLPPGLFRYLEHACEAIAKKGNLSKKLSEGLQHALASMDGDAEASPRLGGLWQLLEALAPHAQDTIASHWCVNMWRRMSTPCVAPFALRLLRVISTVVSLLPEADATWLRSDISLRCTAGPSAVPKPHCEASREMLRIVAALHAEGDVGWAEAALGRLLEQVQGRLTDVFDNTSISTVSLALFQAGELVQLFGLSTDATPKQGRLQEQMAVLAQRCVGGESDTKMPAEVRAHAFAALGKLCLFDAGLARRCAPTFVRELHTATEASVRNNVLVVMCDLCRRHTALVDQHVPALATRLCDPNVTVRRHTLALLSHLIHLDYLKLKGSTFYYLLLPLADNDEGIRQLALSCLNSLMKRKDTQGTSVACSHFVEACFFLNSCTSHHVYNQFDSEHGESLSRHLSEATHGDRTRRRHDVYKVLLKSMADEHKFILAGKIAQDVLDPLVDGVLPLQETKEVLRDVLWVLGSKEICLSASKGKTSDEDGDQDGHHDGGATSGAPAANAAAIAKGKFIGKIARKNLVENVVPIMIALKAILERQHSPLVGKLMVCLREVLSQYKSEAADLFAADPRLASEIEYDMRRPLTPAPVNGLTTPSSRSAMKANSRRRSSMTPHSRCITPASKVGGDTVSMPSPASTGAAVKQWNVVPTPGQPSAAVVVGDVE